MISFDEAAAIVASVARPLGTETLSLEKAAGRVLASDVDAMIDSPRRDVSAMDGYAVRDSDLARLPARLRVVGESFAGQVEVPSIGPGECVRIFTGGAVPDGADRIVIQEVVRRDEDWAIFDQKFGPARHIRPRASDFPVEERLLSSGTLLTSRALVAAAAADVGHVEVRQVPRLVVLGTGDELAEPGTARQRPAAIPESVSLGVASLAEQWGAKCIGRVRLPDDLVQLGEAASEALAKAELVVVTGGASVGERDFAKMMFRSAKLELFFSKVAIKPGKPVWLGRAGGTLVLGLPGNPTSALVTARLFLAPLVAGLCGRDPACAHGWRKAGLASAVPACGERETFLRARWSGDCVEPLGDQDSSAQKLLAEADLLVRRPPGASACAAGEAVEILDF
ncbi:MAG: molybdopterin molybdotransferase MoeA [Pseudomonadota bacterium]|nr:molybdopterin molybdotransferase MoeA [Pseudomonadota bacterium]